MAYRGKIISHYFGAQNSVQGLTCAVPGWVSDSVMKGGSTWPPCWQSVGLSALGCLPLLPWAQSRTVCSALRVQQTRGSMVSPRSEALESLAVVQQGSLWLALYRTGPFTQPRLGKDPCKSHPSRNSQGHNCQGCPASQMALLCCDLFFCIHYPVLHRLGSFISEETIFFRAKLCQFFNNIFPLKGHSSYSLQFWFSFKLVSEGNSDIELCNLVFWTLVALIIKREIFFLSLFFPSLLLSLCLPSTYPLDFLLFLLCVLFLILRCLFLLLSS